MKPLSLLVFFFAQAREKIFIKMHSTENRCYRTGKYTVCRRVRASFSPEILQAGTNEGVKVGSDDSHFNVSLTARDKVTKTQCPQTTTFFDEKGEPKRVQTEIPLLRPYRKATPAHFSVLKLLLKCCFTSTETVGLLGAGAQDVHLDFHTAHEF